ncbi:MULTISPECIES: hypothetical protein [Kordiimonas]|nr:MULTISPECIES: hypothetical protein [Kordiimonas]MCK0068165.1 hypothetical protein [Kordiimonas laminariae]UTW59867.1 hypothetical protein KFE96_06065 [Kordiimonas sp. SCSIO 12603]
MQTSPIPCHYGVTKSEYARQVAEHNAAIAAANRGPRQGIIKRLTKLFR